MITIAPSWLRVEYGGNEAMPARVVVPLVIPKGRYSDVRVRVEPRDGVRLKQAVETGDALQQTFSVGKSGTTGGSFFAAASYEKSHSRTSPSYHVAMTPDFTGVVFSLREYYADQATGIQIAFPIESYTPNPSASFFARVVVEVGKKESDRRDVPQELHPKAARALVINGLRDIVTHGGYNLPRGPFVDFCGYIEPSKSVSLFDWFDRDWDVLHIHCSVNQSDLRFNDIAISADDLFDAVTRCNAKLVFLSSCNSVSVVSRFRESGASALVASTENLLVDYADYFETNFYNSLASGASAAESFSSAKSTADAAGYRTLRPVRSGFYSPMFLDMKRDFSFKPST